MHKSRPSMRFQISASLALMFGVSPVFAAAPTISQVYFDLTSSPGTVSIVGTGFLSTTTVSLGSTSLTVTGASSTVVTASLPGLLAYGDYLMTVTTPGNKGGTT